MSATTLIECAKLDKSGLTIVRADVYITTIIKQITQDDLTTITFKYGEDV